MKSWHVYTNEIAEERAHGMVEMFDADEVREEIENLQMELAHLRQYVAELETKLEKLKNVTSNVLMNLTGSDNLTRGQLTMQTNIACSFLAAGLKDAER